MHRVDLQRTLVARCEDIGVQIHYHSRKRLLSCAGVESPRPLLASAAFFSRRKACSHGTILFRSARAVIRFSRIPVLMGDEQDICDVPYFRPTTALPAGACRYFRKDMWIVRGRRYADVFVVVEASECTVWYRWKPDPLLRYAYSMKFIQGCYLFGERIVYTVIISSTTPFRLEMQGRQCIIVLTR